MQYARDKPKWGFSKIYRSEMDNREIQCNLDIIDHARLNIHCYRSFEEKRATEQEIKLDMIFSHR